MNVAIRRYKVKAGSIRELASRADQEFVPLIRQIPGYVAYYGVETGNESLCTISVFQDQAGVDESYKRAADWVSRNVAELVQGPPEVTAGEVIWGS